MLKAGRERSLVHVEFVSVALHLKKNFALFDVNEADSAVVGRHHEAVGV